MIEILSAPEHVIAFRLSGKLTASDYDRMFVELDSRLRKHERIGLYIDARELRGITPRALAKDLGYAFGKLGEYHRFARGAVVTDKKWLTRLTGISNALIRSVDVQPFRGTEREAAMAWVKEIPEERRTPALRMIPTSRADTLAFAWNGTISATEVADVVRTMEQAVEHHGKIRVLARIEHLGGIAPGALTQSGLLAFKRRAKNKIDRYAVVGGPKWLGRWVPAMRAIFKIDVRHMKENEESAAWAWLEAESLEGRGPRLEHRAPS